MQQEEQIQVWNCSIIWLFINKIPISLCICACLHVCDWDLGWGKGRIYVKLYFVVTVTNGSCKKEKLLRRGVDKFFQTLARLASSWEFSLTKLEITQDQKEEELVRGKITLVRLASGFSFLLADAEFHSQLVSDYPHPWLGPTCLRFSVSLVRCAPWYQLYLFYFIFYNISSNT
jgi:hypothetical protein